MYSTSGVFVSDFFFLSFYFSLFPSLFCPGAGGALAKPLTGQTRTQRSSGMGVAGWIATKGRAGTPGRRRGWDGTCPPDPFSTSRRQTGDGAVLDNFANKGGARRNCASPDWTRAAPHIHQRASPPRPSHPCVPPVRALHPRGRVRVPETSCETP